jgi:metal-responsive CopG/Arc/MetJ family transcriptional regulator
MSTINISLPSEQVNLIDDFVKKFGFANRSEFVRSVIRVLIQKPEIVESASTYPFNLPKTKSVKEIVTAFKKNKKYSNIFLKDLEEGLKESDYFS